MMITIGVKTQSNDLQQVMVTGTEDTAFYPSLQEALETLARFGGENGSFKIDLTDPAHPKLVNTYPYSAAELALDRGSEAWINAMSQHITLTWELGYAAKVTDEIQSAVLSDQGSLFGLEVVS